jgi:ATP-dependent DNA helicase RecG
MVEYLGSGMPRILKAYSRDAYVFSSRFIRTVFPVDPAALELEKEVAQPDTWLGMMSEKMSGKILRMVRSNPAVTISELAREAGVTTRTVERHIKIMQSEPSFF